MEKAVLLALAAPVVYTAGWETHADALFRSRLHSFQENLVPDVTDVPSTWYQDTFEELETQGHLHHASTITNNFDACGRLCVDGRLYLRAVKQ